MKRSVFFKLLSMILVFALLVELLPTNAFAAPSEEDDYLPPAPLEEILDEPTEAETTAEVKALEAAVLGEMTELREENIKHFRMDDGTYTAVTYDQPVHYADAAGKWQDIDNTLTYQSASDAERATYKTGPGSFGASFEETVSEDGRIFETEDGAISLFLNMVDNDDEQAPDSTEPSETDDQPQEEDPGREDDSVDNSVLTEEAVLANEDTLSEEEPNPEVIIPDGESTPGEESSAEEGFSQDENDPPEDIIPPENTEDSEEQPAAGSDDQDPSQDDTPALSVASIRAEVQPVSDVRDTTNKYTAFAPGTQRSSIIYRSILPEIDLQYEVNTLSVKESIIVDAPREEYIYGFRLLLDGLTPTLDDAGAISLTDGDGIEQYFIPAPYMIDDNNDFSNAAHYALESLGNDSWQLTLRADDDWMNDPNRAFPVVIDPTIVKSCTTYSGDISSTYVVERQQTSTHSGYQLYCGKNDSSNGGSYDIYLHVNVLPEIPSNCSVVSAAVGFWQNGYDPANSSSSTYIAAYELTNEGTKTSSQTYASWIHGLTWNTRPADSGIVLDYAKLNASTSYSYQFWDVTAAAVKWYENTANNHGILLKRWESDGSSKRVLLMGYGSYSPSYFVVDYRNNVGIEEKYSYQTQAVDRAGVAYMGDYSGNLTVVTPLASFDSVINGYSLNLVYNSANAIYPFTQNEDAGIHAQGYGGLTGAGWKLSAQETLREKSLTDYNNTTTNYIIYNDSDGTEHYFREDSGGKYLDEDGMNLQITKSGNQYTMIERPATSGTNTTSKAKKVFWRGYLTEIHDNNDNIIYFLYNDHEYYANSDIWKPNGTTGQKLTKIIQINHGGSQCLIAGMVYNESGNYLSRVVDYAGLITTFTYGLTVNGTKFLTSINWNDGKEAYYFYDSTHRRMSGLRDNESGYGLDLTYRYFRHAQAVYQVKEKTTVNGITNYGNVWHAFHHSRQMMEYRFYGPDHTKDTLDDIVTRYSFDFEGRTINAANLDTGKADVLGVSTSSFTKNANTSAQNNRMTGASASGKAAVNLLKNSGAEKLNANQSSGAENWTATHPSPPGDPENTSLGNTVTSDSYVWNNHSISPHTGEKLFKAFINTTSGCSKFYECVFLQSGKTYTLSAYINTAGNPSDHFGPGGAFVAFFTENAYGGHEVCKISSYVNYPTSNTIDGGWERVSVTFTPTEGGRYLAAMGVENCTNVVVSFDDVQLETGDANSTANLIQFGSFETTDASSGSALPDGATTYWTPGTGAAVSTPPNNELSHHGSYCMRIYGSLTEKRHAVETVNVKTGIDRTWLLSGWAKADSVANTQADPGDSNAQNKRYFGLIAEIKYNDNTTEKHYVPFNDDFNDWQYAAGVVVPKVTDQSKTVISIAVYTAYDYNGNTAYFDEISLRPEPVETYKYDDKGNLTAVNSTDNNSDAYTYNGPDLSQAKTGVTGTFNYTYDSNHNMTKATTNSNNTMEVSYTGMGNAYETNWKVSSSSNSWYLKTGTTYTADGNRILTQTDANNITTTYTYNSGSGTDATQGLIGQLKTSYTGSTYPTTYHYSPDNGRQTMTFQSNRIAAHFSYNAQGFTNAIARKSYSRNSYDANPSGTAQWQSYKFATDSFGNPTDIYVSGSDNSVPTPLSTDIRLAHYDYETNLSGVYGIKNGRLRKVTYGNGDYVTYARDRFDQVTRQDYSDGKSDLFFYNSEGNLTKKARAHSLTVDEVYTFEYDSLGRLIRSRQGANGAMYDDGTISDGAMVQRTEHLYDAENRITKQASVLGNRTYTSTYAYNDDVTSNTSGIKDGSLKQVTFSQPYKTMSLSYDSLKHLQSVAVNGLYTRTYYYNSVDAHRSTNQISDLSYVANGSSLSGLSYTYSYDNRGNVTQINQNGSTVATYEYNDQNQMISETRGGDTYTFTYDTAGNILKKAIAGIYGTTKTYTYGFGRWKDLLTAYNGNDIFYEGQNGDPANDPVSGNPTNWYNGSTFTDLTWVKGRQLSSLTKEGANNSLDVDISYAYDMNGIRSSKDVDGEVHTYLTQNGQVVREKIETGGTTKILDFVYDNNGLPFALCYSTNNGQTFTDYFYVTNLQGDVVRLVNSAGGTEANYTYDAWGKLLSVTDGTGATVSSTDTNHIANRNPIRYRGYYYDTETGWYYLQSRYYDPIIGRFINADEPEMALEDSNLIGLNLFAYCNNNPIGFIDEDGMLSNGWKIAITAGILVAAAAVLIATGGIASGPIACVAISAANGAISGAVSGAVSGAIVGGATGAIKHRITTGSWSGAGKAALNGATQGAINGAFSGAITGAVTGALNPSACFVAGTAVAVAGGYAAIETIKEGDLVWAWDEETGDVALKPVKQIFVNESDELIHLTVNGEEIVTTPTHPFYVAQKGWFAAVSLRAGDILVLVNGEYAVVELVQHELLESSVKVYNFEVEDYHTYYVGGSGILVHNSCNHGKEWGHERRQFWRNEAKSAELNKDYRSYVATAKNIARMKRGRAPIGWDGFSVELHHVEGIAKNFKNYIPVSRTLHMAIHTFMH